jgi:heme-binding HmuY-like protein
MDQARWSFAVLALALGAGAGCAGDLRKDRGGGAAGGGNRVESTDQGGGTTLTRIDATKNDLWVYLDLETGAEVFPAAPGSSLAWDLGFQRFKIRTNSGTSGTGGMETAPLPGASFDELTKAPASGYVVDQEEDSADEGTDPDYAFLLDPAWYLYDLGVHAVKARDIVYVVKTVESGFYKVQMTGYYDDAGTGGYPTFRWAPVAPP